MQISLPKDTIPFVIVTRSILYNVLALWLWERASMVSFNQKVPFYIPNVTEAAYGF